MLGPQKVERVVLSLMTLSQILYHTNSFFFIKTSRYKPIGQNSLVGHKNSLLTVSVNNWSVTKITMGVLTMHVHLKLTTEICLNLIPFLSQILNSTKKILYKE